MGNFGKKKAQIKFQCNANSKNTAKQNECMKDDHVKII
jgi:hypothetical protein